MSEIVELTINEVDCRASHLSGAQADYIVRSKDYVGNWGVYIEWDCTGIDFAELLVAQFSFRLLEKYTANPTWWRCEIYSTEKDATGVTSYSNLRTKALAQPDELLMLSEFASASINDIMPVDLTESVKSSMAGGGTNLAIYLLPQFSADFIGSSSYDGIPETGIRFDQPKLLFAMGGLPGGVPRLIDGGLIR